MKAKYQDNLEMLQWIKRYFDLNYNGAPYDALARRKNATLYLIAGCGQTNIGAPQPVAETAPVQKALRPAPSQSALSGTMAPKKVPLQASPSKDAELQKLVSELEQKEQQYLSRIS